MTIKKNNIMIKPIGDRVLVKTSDSESKTESGIYIPETAKVKPNKGTVVSKGDGVFLQSGELKKMQIKVGDVIHYYKGVGTSIELSGEEYLILSEDQIFAKDI